CGAWDSSLSGHWMF
nr:immunoglobulin light chain junction region [Macaca mulatta]